MSVSFLSLHVDRPVSTRVAIDQIKGPDADWRRQMEEITKRTASLFGSVILGLHPSAGKESYVFFAGVAHRRDSCGKFVLPERREDWLYDEQGHALAGAMTKSVQGTLIDAKGRRADDHIVFCIETSKMDAVQAHVARYRAGEVTYNAVTSNCVLFALKALACAGIQMPTESLSRSVARLRRPQDMTAAIAAARDAGPVVYTQTAKPILLGL